MSRRLLVALPLFAACTGGGDAPKPPDPPPPAAPLVDAPVMDLQPSGVFDPAGGRHLDDDVLPPPPVVPARPSERNPRAQRPIDLTLRSVPPGATAAVDGVPIGPTPTYWAGDANGRVHEFTFVLAHYSVARYRFVPITSGILFARLDAVAGDEPPPDGGIPPIPLAVPGLVPPPPVPTVIAPAPRPPPPPPADAHVEPPPTDAAEPELPASDAAAPSGTVGPAD